MRVYEPAGPAGDELWRLILVFLVVTGVPAFFFLVALVVAAVKKKRSSVGTTSSDPKETRVIVGFGGIFAGLLLVGLMFVSFGSTSRVVDPPSTPRLEIEFVGHQFWWEARYPESGVVTANEIHIPAGVPVRFLMRTADVIHSFWVPELHGKIDMIPGRTHRFWLQADRPGEYRGICTEFCGIQHALMGFLVIAEPEDEFRAWLEAQRAPQASEGRAPALAAGREVYERARCHLCHVVRGDFEVKSAEGVGPDLTHLASRRTIGAALAPLRRDTLRQFVLDPHVLKPGIRMPRSDLTEDDADALVAYLESLR